MLKPGRYIERAGRLSIALLVMSLVSAGAHPQVDSGAPLADAGENMVEATVGPRIVQPTAATSSAILIPQVSSDTIDHPRPGGPKDAPLLWIILAVVLGFLVIGRPRRLHQLPDREAP